MAKGGIKICPCSDILIPLVECRVPLVVTDRAILVGGTGIVAVSDMTWPSSSVSLVIIGFLL